MPAFAAFSGRRTSGHPAVESEVTGGAGQTRADRAAVHSERNGVPAGRSTSAWIRRGRADRSSGTCFSGPDQGSFLIPTPRACRVPQARGPTASRPGPQTPAGQSLGRLQAVPDKRLGDGRESARRRLGGDRYQPLFRRVDRMLDNDRSRQYRRGRSRRDRTCGPACRYDRCLRV